jgi:hypothetical protein
VPSQNTKSLQQLQQEAYLAYLAKLMKKFESDTARLKLADKLMSQVIAKAKNGQLDDEGDMATATRLYVKVAASRPPNQASVEAKKRLAFILKESGARFAKLQKDMAQLEGGTDAVPEGVDRDQAIAECIRNLDELADKCGKLPKLGDSIRTYVTKQNVRPHVQAAVKEAVAKKLWQAGQKYEADDEVCCAMNAYEEALLQRGAPSAFKAKERVKELRGNFKNILAQKKCKTIESCHVKYAVAEKLALNDQSKAKNLFAEIVRYAPPESEVHVAARQQMLRLADVQ